jgi:hypothetical protein
MAMTTQRTGDSKLGYARADAQPGKKNLLSPAVLAYGFGGSAGARTKTSKASLEATRGSIWMS